MVSSVTPLPGLIGNGRAGIGTLWCRVGLTDVEVTLLVVNLEF